MDTIHRAHARRTPRNGFGQRPQWAEYGGRASQAIYCASVSPSVRYVSSNVRLTLASVSRNVRRKWPSIARRAVHDCAPLHLRLKRKTAGWDDEFLASMITK
jgi:hypothetical protein